MIADPEHREGKSYRGGSTATARAKPSLISEEE